MSRGLRTVRQEQMFQPKLNKISLTSFVTTEAGKKEREASLRQESQGELTISERVERLGLASRLSSSPPYSPQRSSTPGDIITIDRCLDHTLHLNNQDHALAMRSQRSLQRGHQVRGGQREAEEGVDLQQTSLAMNFDLGHHHHLIRWS